MSASGEQGRSPAVRGAALACLAICLAATVPYVSTVDDYFVRDDFGVVQLLAGKPASYFPRWFVTSWMDGIWGFIPDEIRPFPALSYQITASWGAGSPVGHHLLNIALHAANGLLVFAVARVVAALSLAAAAFAALAFVLLPVHAESVAWVTGRVDSMPACFYIASFLAYAWWGQQASRFTARYLGSLALFFVALFTKQNAITMIATLAAYDVMLRRLPVRAAAGAWAPFAILTAGYLWLRYFLFGEIAREGRLGADMLSGFVGLANRHLTHVVTGHPDGSRALVWIALIGVAALWWVGRRHGDARFRPASALLYFGPVWWLIGVAPIAVAGYESPRHVYLAAVGWALVLGIACDLALKTRAAANWRRGVAAACGVMLLFYSARLYAAVGEWNTMAAVSEAAVRDLRDEALNAIPGTLLLAGAPARSWEWALPFAVRPPFTPEDLTTRVFIVSPRALYCCRGQWFDATRRTLRAWAGGSAPGSVIALRWDEHTGALSRATDVDNPALPAIARALLELEQPELLDATLQRLLEQQVGSGRR